MPLARRRQFEPGDPVGLLVTSRCHDGEMRFRPENRRADVERRVHLVASVFAIDVLAWAVLDNHWHGSLRARPDRAVFWTREEVARRWLTLHPMRTWRRLAGVAVDADPSDAEIAAWLEARDRDDARSSSTATGGVRGHGLASGPTSGRSMVGFTVEDARVRLCDPSWFMREVNEPIARRFNRADRRSGAFFGGRFHSREVLDHAGELAAAIYVDLNEWRAFTVELPERSTASSIARRIDAIRRGIDSGLPLVAGLTDAQYLAVLDAVARQERTARSVGSNRLHPGSRRARRTLPHATPSIFDRIGVPRLDVEDARLQELVIRFVREATEDIERLEAVVESTAENDSTDAGSDECGSLDGSTHDETWNGRSRPAGASARSRTPAAEVAAILAGVRAEWRRASRLPRTDRTPSRERAAHDIRSPCALRSAVIASVCAVGDGLHARSSALGQVAALEAAAARRGQSWVVGALHRGRRATQHRLAEWMHRHAIHARPRPARRAVE